MQRNQQMAMAFIVATIATCNGGGAVRSVQRSRGGWRGSTMTGYIFGDEITYRSNFRMSKQTFQRLLEMLSKTSFGVARPSNLREQSAPPTRPGSGVSKSNKRAHRCKNMSFARTHTDPPSTQFKLATCLYAMAHGGKLKLTADVAGIGESTLRRWMHLFCSCVNSSVRAVYMPVRPFAPEALASVQGQFASRRGFPNVTLACDGSHIPFTKYTRKDANDYRNYKGWHSILTVAFVDSFHRFFDLHVGYPGRAGDNTVLRHFSTMSAFTKEPEKWLGKGGLTLGDSGASDGDKFFLNPYHCPTEPEKCWFNFCHSSTRFFVEETFGRWKNRWRFLMEPSGTKIKLTCLMVYASAVLHNLCTVHAYDDVEMSVGMSPHWASFFDQYKAQRCPTCKARNVGHCIHQAGFRNGAAQQASIRKAPSVQRDELCAKLWAEVCSGYSLPVSNDDLTRATPDLKRAVQDVQRDMQARARITM